MITSGWEMNISPLLQGTIDFASFFTSYLQENWAFSFKCGSEEPSGSGGKLAVLKTKNVLKGVADAGNS